MDEVEVFSEQECERCGERRVTLGGRCRTCLSNGLGGEVGPLTLAAINTSFARASERLLGPLS